MTIQYLNFAMPRSHNLEVRELQNLLSERMSGFKSCKGLAFWVEIPAAALFYFLLYFFQFIQKSFYCLDNVLWLRLKNFRNFIQNIAFKSPLYFQFKLLRIN